MVRDMRDALGRAQGDPPPWQHGVDDFVVAGKRLARRRRTGVAVGSSALAGVLAAGSLFAAHARIWRPASTSVVAINPATGGEQPTPSGGAASSPSRGSTTTAAAPRTTHLAEEELRAFTDAGYHYADAVLVARMWGPGTTVATAKTQLGEKLLLGYTPPIRPGDTASTVSNDAALAAFFDNGNTYDDAVRLAKLWRVSANAGDLGPVKVTAGRRLLAGHALPR